MIDAMFIAAEVALACIVLLLALFCIKLLRYIVLWYSDRKYLKQATFIKEDYHRIRAQQLVADMKRRVK